MTPRRISLVIKLDMATGETGGEVAARMQKFLDYYHPHLHGQVEAKPVIEEPEEDLM